MTVEKDITELSEEIFIRRYPEYVMNGEPLSPYYDLFASGYEIANIEKDKQIAELKKIEEEYYDFIQKKNEEDWKGDNVVGCLKLKIEQLKAQIEKMKCCQNCIFMDFSQPNYCKKGVYRERQYVCDEWKFGN